MERRDRSLTTLKLDKEFRLINISTTEKWPEGFQPESGIPIKLSLLRWKLSCKSKQEPKFRFYTLYDRIYRSDVLETAYKRIKANDGGPGTDGITFEMIELQEGGSEKFIKEMQLVLKEGNYDPKSVRRTYIPKSNGKLRPLGIPCICDRLVQMATLLILEPIFEADFQECSFGFRPGKSAHQALKKIQGNLTAGCNEVYDADLASYFDTVNHGKLMILIGLKVTDRSVLSLIRKWLKCPFEETDRSGKVIRTYPTEGTPQGGVISPLLANIYLNYFDKAFLRDKHSPLHTAGAQLIRYADDMVIMARELTQEMIDWIESKLEGKLELTINREKTKTIKVHPKRDELCFLGYSFSYYKDLKGRGHYYLNMQPSKKALQTLRGKIKESTSRNTKLHLLVVIEEMNKMIKGWKNYFSLGYPRKAYRGINQYVQVRVDRFTRNRSQRKMKPFKSGETIYTGLKRLGFKFL